MNIHSNIIESDALGQLHVLEVGYGPVVSMSANSMGGSATEPDTVGISKEASTQLGGTALIFDRPGSGYSTMPEDKELRNDMNRHGFLPASEEVGGVLESYYGSLDHTTAIGHSLGAYAIALIAFQIGAKELITLDASVGNRISKAEGLARYASNYALELAEGLIGNKVDYALDEADVEALQAINKERGKRQSQLTLHEVRSFLAQAEPHLGDGLAQALETNKIATAKLGFTGRSYNLSPSRIRNINKLSDSFNTGGSRRVGLVRGGELGRSHKTAALPAAVRYMITTPVDQMATSL